MPKSSTERSREYRKRQHEEENFDLVKYWQEERDRIAEIRKEQQKRELSEEDINMKKKYERERKREQRKRKNVNKVDKVSSGVEKRNRKLGLRRRLERVDKLKKDNGKLLMKVKMFTNVNRKLKRKLTGKGNENNSADSGSRESAEESVSDSDSEQDISGMNVSAEVLKNVSPDGKRRAVKRLKLCHPTAETSRALRLDRKKTASGLGRKSHLQKGVEEFMYRDSNTMVVPDEKKAKKGLRYRLSSLKVLSEKFVAEMNVECSYAQFTRLVPEDIIKPKPEDWGTCLCITCLNPELKISCLKKEMPELGITTNNVCEKNEEELKDICKKIEESKLTFEYLEWTREKGNDEKKGKDEEVKKRKASSYHSVKNACSTSAEDFGKRFLEDVRKLKDHTENMIAQYRRIKEVKKIVSDPNNNSKAIRIDWSENVELYQTQQEKSQYYTTISASVNTAVFYESNSASSSIGTISDVKSHQASATMASLEEMLSFKDLTDTKVLYIISDSPGSQYRNRKMAYLIKEWAKKQLIDVYWVFTEVGHGKGPMDGVGAVIKNCVKDTLAYHPEGVIRNTDQLLMYLPDLPKVLLSTYNNNDVNRYIDSFPKPIDNLSIICNAGFGISKVHEIYFPSHDETTIKWKKISSESEYAVAMLSTKPKTRIRRKKISTGAEDNETVEDADNEEADCESDNDSNDSSLDDEETTAYSKELTLEELTTRVHESMDEEENLNKFYCVYYDQTRYWGKLLKVFSDDVDTAVNKVQIQFLAYRCGGFWDWPKREDKRIIDVRYVFYGPALASSPTNKGFIFEEDIEALKYYKLIQKHNRLKNNK